jgi:hypothetical protein
MASINTGKVVTGGLVAGVVANAVDFVTNNYVLAAEWQTWASQHNIDPASLTSPSIAGTWIVVDFFFGLLLVWTYAAMRPRFGAGVQTAVIAGLTIYLAPTVVLFGFTMMGMLSWGLFVKGSCAAIVSTFGAAIVGAALYKEESAPASSAYAKA